MPLAELAGLTAWMPGNAGDCEWARYRPFDARSQWLPTPDRAFFAPTVS